MKQHISFSPQRWAALCLFMSLLLARPALGDRPNILLAISDDQSFPHAGAYGDPAARTPAFDDLAKQGVLFTRAYAGSPGCSPSRATLLTGRHTWQNEHAGTHASAFSHRLDVYPDLLEQAGYFVGYTGKGWGPGNFKAGGRTRNPAGPSFAARKLPKSERRPGMSSNDYAANFSDFLDKREDDAPFCFWYGAHEPHRGFGAGNGIDSGGKLDHVAVPKFLPDTEGVRSDLLDYAAEIQHFDTHLGRMIELLKKHGLYENTLIVVTSDNGMAFPRAKANCYDHGIHVPMLAAWPSKIPAGRTIEDLVGFVDLAPTFLDAAGLPPSPRMSGTSLLPALTSDASGLIDPSRRAYSARERHSSSRYNNSAYPQRAMRSGDWLLIHNFRPTRWPAGTPRKLQNGQLGPEHGGYHDIDACPTLSMLIAGRDAPDIGAFFHLAVDKRPEWELFNVRDDPACLKNLAASESHQTTFSSLQQELDDYLRRTGDPRALDGGEVFETYRRYSPIRTFPRPE